MKKIRYLIIIIPVLIVMLFSQPNVHGFDFVNWRPEHNDLFYIIDFDTEIDRVYLGYVSNNLGDSIVYFKNEYIGQDLIIENEIGAMVVYSEGIEKYFPANPLDYDIFSPGDKFSVVSEHMLSNGVETVTLFNALLSVYFVYRKDLLPEGAPYYVIDNNGKIGLPDWDAELYDYAYNQGMQAERDYWESIIDNMLDAEYSVGYDNGYLDALHDNMGDIPTWLINSDLKVNEELYNYIDYDNLVYYENVGQVVVNGDEEWRDNVTLENIYELYFMLDEVDSGLVVITNNANIYARTTSFPAIVIGIPKTYLIGFNDDMLTSEKLALAKDYLSQNSLTITYELAEKQEKIISPEEVKQVPFYEYGISQGYINGYGKGQADSKAIQGFIPTIIGAIWVVIANFMQFEVFGLSLWWILGIIVTFSLAIFLIRLVSGYK